MKTIHAILYSTLFMTPIMASAEITDIDSAKLVDSASSIAAGDTWNITSTGSVEVRNATLDILGGITNSNSGESIMVNAANGQTSTVNLNGGSISTSVNTSLNLGKDWAGGVVNFNMTNGAEISQGSNAINIEIGRNAKTYLNVDSTSSITANQITLATRGGNTNYWAEVNVNGGSISLSADFVAAAERDGGTSAFLNISDGGTMTARDMKLQDSKIGSDTQPNVAVAVIKGANSSLELSRHMVLGNTSTSGNANDRGELVIHTGSYVRVSAITTVNNTGLLRVKLDSSNLASSSPLLTAVQDTYLYNNDGAKKSIIIDGELLDSAGQDASIVLFKFESAQGNLKLNNVRTIFSDLEAALVDFIGFENNTNLAFWEDFGYGDLVFDNSTFTISLNLTAKAIPEPAAFAAIFGALAMALASYRRRR